MLVAAGVTTVRGNHDRWLCAGLVRDLPHAHRLSELEPPTVAFLASLPPTMTLDVDGKTLLLCHGVGPDDMQLLRSRDTGYALTCNRPLQDILDDPTIHILVGGHTHEPMVRSIVRPGDDPALVVVNPGTLARDHQPGFAILDLSSMQVEFFAIDERMRVSRVG